MSALDRPTLARRALLDAMRVSNLFDRRWGALSQTADITSAQWLTLGLLEREDKADGMTPTELCRRLCVSKQNMTGMILRLEKKGLIERRPDPHDRRSFRVKATPAGSKAIQRLVPFESEFFLRQVESLSDERLLDLSQALRSILQKLQSEEMDAKRAASS